MTQDEIIEMARQAGFMLVTDSQQGQSDWYECFTEEIEAFAKLVEERTAAKEREACALICDKEQEVWGWDSDVIDAAQEIRARGKA